MSRILLGLGSNLGDRRATLRAAIMSIEKLPATRVATTSEFMETIPVGGPPNQPPFLNSAILLETELNEIEVWQACRQIEEKLGRVRNVPWGARVIDIDILLSQASPLHADAITIPHPRLMVRDFALGPACEIAGDWIHPVISRSLQEIREQLRIRHKPIWVVPGYSALRDAATEICEKVFTSGRADRSENELREVDVRTQSLNFEDPARSWTISPIEWRMAGVDPTNRVLLAEMRDPRQREGDHPEQAEEQDPKQNRANETGLVPRPRGAIVVESWDGDGARERWEYMSPAARRLASERLCPFARMDLGRNDADQYLAALVQGILDAK